MSARTELMVTWAVFWDLVVFGWLVVEVPWLDIMMYEVDGFSSSRSCMPEGMDVPEPITLLHSIRRFRIRP